MANELIAVIKERRSIRKFEDTSLDKKLLDEIIQAGRYAPSAKNLQPWKFIVITNKNTIQDLSDTIKNEMKKILKKRHILKFFYPQLKEKETLGFLFGTAMAPTDVIFHKAPALVFILTRKGLLNKESCACCAQNMMLAAHSLGIGSCWIGFANFLEQNNKKMEEIGIPEGYHIAAAVVFGKPTSKSRQAPIRKPMADVIKWIE